MANILKKINQNMPEPIMKLLGPIVRRRLINNKIFKKEYDLLINESIEDKDEFHLRKLNELLDYVNKYVPYYRDNDDYPSHISSLDEMKNLPMLTSDELKKNEVSSEEEMSFYQTCTGGSIGDPLNIYQAMDSIYKERAYIYNYMRQFEYDVNTSKVVNFRAPSDDGRLSRYNPLYNEYILNPFYLNSKTFKDYAKIIEKFKPDFIQGYPSSITTYAKLAKNQGFDYQFKAVMFVSEEVRPETQSEIERLLNIKSYAYYGHTERAVFGEEINGSYTFNDFYGYTELVDSEIEGEFEIVATGYINRKMPLIRYKTDDILYKVDGKWKIKGRRKSNIFLYNSLGDPISIMNADPGIEVHPNILAYQIIQREVGKVEVVVESDLEGQSIKDFEDLLRSQLGELFDVEYSYRPVQRTVRGKLMRIIQEVDTSKL